MDVPDGKFVLRPWQERHVAAAKAKLLSGENVLVSAPFCGSGKTEASLHASNDAFLSGRCGGNLTLVPRINLAKQYEKAWNKYRRFLPSPTMGRNCYRTNVPPLLTERDQYGIIATYGSFVSRPELYFHYVREKRASITFDEGQILGYDEASGDGTLAAKLIQEGYTHRNGFFGDGHCDVYRSLFELSPFVQILTGTPNRSDGRKLLRGRYSDPDPSGRIHLLADVTASYLEGVSLEYLRGFEAHLTDGQAWRRFVDANPEQVILSQMSEGASQILMHPGFWKPMVDSFADQTRDVKCVDQRFCGLGVGCRRDHVRAMVEYAKSKHRDLRVGFALSDDPDSQASLDAFAAGEYDLFFSVLMAYVGFNHPWIRVILCLSAYRETGFLDQLFGRAARRVYELPHECQNVRWLAPYDRWMEKWTEEKRTDADAGMKVKEKRGGGGGGPPSPCTLSDVTVTDTSVIGLDETDNLSPETVVWIEDHKKIAGLGGADVTRLAHLLTLAGADLSALSRSGAARAGAVVSGPSEITDEDQRVEFKRQLKKEANTCDEILQAADPSVGYGRTYIEIQDVFGIASTKNQGAEKLAEILTWVRTSWKPYCEKLQRGS